MTSARWVERSHHRDLPDTPITEPYRAPSSAARPTITIRKASEALVLQALFRRGCHRNPRWAAATTYTPGGITTPAPLMPLIGKAHLAAKVLEQAGWTVRSSVGRAASKSFC